MPYAAHGGDRSRCEQPALPRTLYGAWVSQPSSVRFLFISNHHNSNVDAKWPGNPAPSGTSVDAAAAARQGGSGAEAATHAAVGPSGGGTSEETAGGAAPPAKLEFVRVTKDVATGRKLPHGAAGAPRLKELGFKSVLNTLDPSEADFPEWEEGACRDAGLAYECIGCIDPATMLDLELLNRMIDAVDELPKPCLVHCERGTTSSIVVLCKTARDTGSNALQVYRWAGQLGVPQLASVAPLHKLIADYIKQVDAQRAQMAASAGCDADGRAPDSSAES